jgi:hypothetical protein
MAELATWQIWVISLILATVGAAGIVLSYAFMDWYTYYRFTTRARKTPCPNCGALFGDAAVEAITFDHRETGCPNTSVFRYHKPGSPVVPIPYRVVKCAHCEAEFDMESNGTVRGLYSGRNPGESPDIYKARMEEQERLEAAHTHS